MQPDRLHHGPRQRHRVPVDSGDQDRDQQRHLPAHADNMDVNAGAIADGEKTVQQVGREIFDLMLEWRRAQKTCAERLGHKEFVPWRIGPVM